MRVQIRNPYKMSGISEESENYRLNCSSFDLSLNRGGAALMMTTVRGFLRRVCFAASVSLSDIGFRYVAAHHAVAVEIVGVFTYGVLHHPYPGAPVFII